MIIKKDYTTITNCYLLSNEMIEQKVAELITLRLSKLYSVTRMPSSYICEIKAHKRLYKLGLFRSHTKDADLEEFINPVLEFFYKIIGV